MKKETVFLSLYVCCCLSWYKTNNCIPTPVSVIVSLSHVAIGNVYESWHSTWLRSWAMDECLEHIKADDQFTHCISIGPVSPSCPQVALLPAPPLPKFCHLLYQA